MKTAAEMGEANNEDEGDEKCHINRLPDELILLIFDTLSDAESLFRCSLVSKRFAPLVFQTRTVSLQVPEWDPNFVSKNSLSQKLINFFKNPVQSIHQFLQKPSDSPPPSLSRSYLLVTRLAHFLKQLTCIDSLNLQLSPSGLNPSSSTGSFVRWKADFDSYNLSSFLLLFAKTLVTTEHEAEEQVAVKPELTNQEIMKYINLMGYHQKDAQARHSLLWPVVLSNPCHIRSATITDRNQQGKILLSEEQIVRLKSDGVHLREKTTMSFKFWYTPVLRLPSSGFMLKEAKLLALRYCDKEEGIHEDDAWISRNAFEKDDMLIPLDHSLSGNKVCGICPGIVVHRVSKVVSKILQWTLSGHNGLNKEAEHGEHGQSTIFYLLYLKFSKCLGIFSKAQGVEASTGIKRVDHLT
ncbi:hypothetical protein RJ640_030038 [Escallonia rubra]|uniref:F-box domain-containing protein n=1 Tax=Escallonia rubra TaxID=112253 RepID=A0AA88S9R9_9ASTE|nr:hypothetical protein RJ640_030038 [Escallonia rubra]